MPFLGAHAGILTPDDLAVVRNVYDRITSESWVSKDRVTQEHFARYILTMYRRGMCDPELLFRICLVAAKHKLVDPVSGSSGQRELG